MIIVKGEIGNEKKSPIFKAGIISLIIWIMAQVVTYLYLGKDAAGAVCIISGFILLLASPMIALFIEEFGE